MKKILILFALIVIGFSVNAQPTVVASMTANGNYAEYTKTTDIDSAYSTVAKSWDVFVGKDYVYLYDILLDADVNASLPDASFSFQVKGSLDDVNYYNVGSAVTWYANSDTVLRFENVNTAAYNVTWVQEISTNNDTLQYPAVTRTAWRYLRVTATGSGATAKMYIHKLAVAVFRKPDEPRL